MFHFFGKKSQFELYYSKFNSLPVIKKCRHHKAFTAAYLFVISDSMLSSEKYKSKRLENSKQIFSLLEERYLSKEELSIFDDSVMLLAQILNGKIKPRGDWCFYSGEPTGTFYDLHLCYGDLLYAPDCFADYQHSTLVVRGIAESISFSKVLDEAYELMIEYVKTLSDLYLRENS